jgi:hypothetical protein
MDATAAASIRKWRNQSAFSGIAAFGTGAASLPFILAIS